MSVGINITDAYRDLLISVGHNIIYPSIIYYPDTFFYINGKYFIIKYAFDKVPHARLLHKLSYYGVNHNTVTWIKSFLENSES
jgi:hypothetical protein